MFTNRVQEKGEIGAGSDQLSGVERAALEGGAVHHQSEKKKNGAGGRKGKDEWQDS